MTGIDRILKELKKNEGKSLVKDFIEELLLEEIKGVWGWEKVYKKKIEAYSQKWNDQK